MADELLLIVALEGFDVQDWFLSAQALRNKHQPYGHMQILPILEVLVCHFPKIRLALNTL